MSNVRANARSESKMEYVYNARKLYLDVLGLLSRLSARYTRLLSEKVSTTALEILSNVVCANAIMPSDKTRYEMRKCHLLEARAKVDALDVQLWVVYDILSLNPQGSYTNSKGTTLTPTKAVARLNGKAEKIGLEIDRERNLIRGVLDSDLKRIKSIIKDSPSLGELDEDSVKATIDDILVRPIHTSYSDLDSMMGSEQLDNVEEQESLESGTETESELETETETDNDIDNQGIIDEVPENENENVTDTDVDIDTKKQ